MPFENSINACRARASPDAIEYWRNLEAVRFDNGVTYNDRRISSREVPLCAATARRRALSVPVRSER